MLALFAATTASSGNAVPCPSFDGYVRQCALFSVNFHPGECNSCCKQPCNACGAHSMDSAVCKSECGSRTGDNSQYKFRLSRKGTGTGAGARNQATTQAHYLFVHVTRVAEKLIRQHHVIVMRHLCGIQGSRASVTCVQRGRTGRDQSSNLRHAIEPRLQIRQGAEIPEIVVLRQQLPEL